MELINHIDETISYNKNNIRITGSYNEPWFVAKDVCEILELKDVSNALLNISEKWKGTKVIRTPGGEQNMRIINEAGLYKLIMRSNKPIAQKFQEHVCEVILSSIRKQGEYKLQSIIDSKNKEINNIEDEKNKEIKQLEDEKNKEIDEISKKNKELSRKVKRKKLQTFKKGELIYLGQLPFDKDNFKIGSTIDMNARVSDYNTPSSEDFNVFKIWHTRFYKQIEDAIKINFENYRLTLSKELYEMKYYNEIYEYIEKSVKFFGETDKFIIPEPEIELEEITEIIDTPPNLIIIDNNRTEKKKCTKCLYLLPLYDFYLRNDTINLEDFNLDDEEENEKYKDQKYRSHCKKCYNESTKDLRLKIKSDSNNLRKNCTDCKLLLPFDIFYKDINNNLYNNCIECYNKINNFINVKQCKDCKLVLSTDKFSKHTGVLLRTQCKDCRNNANQSSVIPIKCEFCNTEIKHKNNLSAHQKTKLCLAKKNNIPLDNIEKRKTPLINIRSKIVIQFSIMDGTIIKKYNSVAEASKETKIGRTNIEKCCNKINKTSGGFIWNWEENISNL